MTTKPTITLSDDLKYYYITYGTERTEFWLSVDKITDISKYGSALDKSAIEVPVLLEISTGNEKYIREMLPFALWKIKSSVKSTEIDMNEELFLDYAQLSNWQLKTDEFKCLVDKVGELITEFTENLLALVRQH